MNRLDVENPAIVAIKRELEAERGRAAEAESSQSHVEDRLAEAEQAVAKWRAELQQIEADQRGAIQNITALERSLAVLVEQMETPATPADPVPAAPPLTPERERIRHELEGLGHHATEAPPKPKTVRPAKSATRRNTGMRSTKGDPMRVRSIKTGRRQSRGTTAKRIHTEDGGVVDLATIGQIHLDRADLVYEIYVDAGRPLSNYEVALVLVELMDDTSLDQAMEVAATSARVLATQDRICYTNEKGFGPAGTKRLSPIWTIKREGG